MIRYDAGTTNPKLLNRLCDWCDHQALCPAFGGTPPPLPVRPEARVDEPPPTVCEASG